MREPVKKTTYNKDGSVSYESYHIDGKLHRVDGPAFIGNYKDGSVNFERYLIDGKKHRVDGPALIDYHEDGSVYSERYSIAGESHRVDGPACIEYNDDGSVDYENYRIDGKEYTKEEYYQTIKEAKELDKVLQLLDPRAWVRELGRTS